MEHYKSIYFLAAQSFDINSSFKVLVAATFMEMFDKTPVDPCSLRTRIDFDNYPH